MSFHIGQRVVCVDTIPTTDPSCPCPEMAHRLQKYRVYTVVGAFVKGNVPSIQLAEVRSIFDRELNGDLGFRACRFRPVRETNIDVFTKMLEKEPTGA